MGEFYCKNEKGEYIPVEFKSICTKDWNNKLIVVKVGSEQNPAPEKEVDLTVCAMSDADVLKSLKKTSFIVTTHNLEFDSLDNLDDLGKKYVSINVTSCDNLNDLGELKKEAQRQLKSHTKKTVMLPSPITVGEFKELYEIKRRCDNRRGRRGCGL